MRKFLFGSFVATVLLLTIGAGNVVRNAWDSTTDAATALTALNGLSSVSITPPSFLSGAAGAHIGNNYNIGLTWNNQSPNTLLSGPVNGGSAAPTFRLLQAADIPSLDAGKITSGTISRPVNTLGGGYFEASVEVGSGDVTVDTGNLTVSSGNMAINGGFLTASSFIESSYYLSAKPGADNAAHCYVWNGNETGLDSGGAALYNVNMPNLTPGFGGSSGSPSYSWGLRNDEVYAPITLPGCFYIGSDAANPSIIIGQNGGVGIGSYDWSVTPPTTDLSPTAAVQFYLSDSDPDGGHNPNSITQWDKRHAVWGTPGPNGGGLGVGYASYENAVYSFYLQPGIQWCNAYYTARDFRWILSSVSSYPVLGLNETVNFDGATISQFVSGADPAALYSGDANFGNVLYNGVIIHAQSSMGNPNALNIVDADGFSSIASIDNSGTLSCAAVKTANISIAAGGFADGKVLTSDVSGNGTWQTPVVAANNVSFTTDAFSGPSGTLALNNNYSLYTATANVTVSAVSGAASGKTTWETLEVFNNSGGSITATISVSGALAVGSSTASPITIAAGKSGFITLQNRNNVKTFYWTSVQQ